MEEEGEEEDPIDILGSGAFSLFGDVQPALGEPTKLFVYSPPPSISPSWSLNIRVPPATTGKTDLMWHYVWKSALRLADLIVLGKVDVRGRRVIELGAGAGIPGLVAAREGAASVVLSDFDDNQLIANLNDNITLALSPSTASVVRAVPFTWGTPPDHLDKDYDVILIADCLWYSSAHVALVASLGTLLSRQPSSFIQIVAGVHSGRDAVRSFLRMAQDGGLVKRGEWIEVDVEGNSRPWGWDVQDGAPDKDEGIVDRNRWTVEGQLVWDDRQLIV